MGSQVRETKDLRAEILSRLREHELLEVAGLDVRVRRSTAFTEDAVPNLRQKKLATQVACGVKGIRDVVYMLRVTPSPVVDDESLKVHVKRLLARNPKIDGDEISVEVVNGVVYLSGSVNVAAESRLIELEV